MTTNQDKSEKSFVDEIIEACHIWVEKYIHASMGEREAYRKGYIDGSIATLQSHPHPSENDV